MSDKLEAKLDLWESGAKFCKQGLSDPASDTWTLCDRNIELIQALRVLLKANEKLARGLNQHAEPLSAFYNNNAIRMMHDVTSQARTQVEKIMGVSDD